MSRDVVDQIRKATIDGAGVEAIVDCVNSATVNPSLVDLLTGPKKLAEVMTGANLEKVPRGVDHTIISGQAIFGAPGGRGLFAALGRLLEERKYQLPVDVKVVGHSLESDGEVSLSTNNFHLVYMLISDECKGVGGVEKRGLRLEAGGLLLSQFHHTFESCTPQNIQKSC